MRDEAPGKPASWGRRIAWLVGIWTASVLALAVLAGLLRIAMGWLGMTA